jgi:hypothetical protein
MVSQARSMMMLAVGRAIAEKFVAVRVEHLFDLVTDEDRDVVARQGECRQGAWAAGGDLRDWHRLKRCGVEQRLGSRSGPSSQPESSSVTALTRRRNSSGSASAPGVARRS